MCANTRPSVRLHVCACLGWGWDGEGVSLLCIVYTVDEGKCTKKMSSGS